MTCSATWAADVVAAGASPTMTAWVLAEEPVSVGAVAIKVAVPMVIPFMMIPLVGRTRGAAQTYSSPLTLVLRLPTRDTSEDLAVPGGQPHARM